MTKSKYAYVIFMLSLCGYGTVYSAEPNPLPDLESLLNAPLESSPKNISLTSRATDTSQHASGSVYVVTAEDIRDLQLGTLADILKLFPGLHIIDERVFTFLISRSIGQPGDYNSRLLFLLDGHRINENTAGAGLLSDEFFLNSQWIERVEYHPGAPSATYGSNAMLGVVHIISKKTKNDPSLEISPMLSNKHNQQLNLLMQQQYGEIKSWLGLSFSQFDQLGIENNNQSDLFGFYDFSQRVKKFTAKVNHQQTSILLSHVHRESDTSLPFALALSEIPVRHVENTLSIAGLNHSWTMNNDVDLFANIATFRQNFQIRDPLLAAPDTVVQSEYLLVSQWSVIDSRLLWRPRPNLRWLTGIDLQIDHNLKLTESFPELNLEQILKDRNIQQGYYTELQWQVLPQLDIHTSIRYDQDQFQLAAWSPAFALIWQATPNTLLKLRQSKAVRASSFVERYYNETFDFPLPSNEYVKATEFSFEQRLFSNWRWFGSVYYNELKDLIFTPKDFLITINAFPVRTYGIETGLDLRWNQIRTQISYSRQDGRAVQGQLTNAPKHLGKVQLFYPITEKLSMNWQLYAVSERPYGQLKLAGFVKQDVGLIWSFSPKFNLQLNIKNLSNTQAIEIPERNAQQLQIAPRTAELRFNWIITP